MAASENRLVHLDLKGAPLKLDFLEQLMPVLSEWGASGLLVEWEDTFPYSGNLIDIGSNGKCGYSENEVRRIHCMAAQYNLSIMPLVQTFGHLEFVLKHDKWKELREVGRYPAALCPSHPLTLPLVTDMLDQLLALSPNATHVHIGADEVWHLGRCERCASMPKPQLFLSHVTAVLRHLAAHHSHVQPVMWDDMLRSLSPDVMREFKIGELVEPMVWHYNSADSFSLPQEMWDKYSAMFGRVWLASAFKGATGSCQLLPVVSHHVSNHQQWLITADEVRPKFKHVCGIALTGWSRYDHFATLCELLPPALPSLALCLRGWTSRCYDNQTLLSVSKELGYKDSALTLNPFPRPQGIAGELRFPGWRLAVGVEWLANLRAKHTHIIDSDQVNTWLNSWQLKNNFTNSMQIERIHSSFKELESEWDSLERYLLQQMPEVYYEQTMNEWMDTLVTPLQSKLRKLTEDARKQLELNSL